MLFNLYFFWISLSCSTTFLSFVIHSFIRSLSNVVVDAESLDMVWKLYIAINVIIVYKIHFARFYHSSIFRLTTLTMDGEKSRDSHTYIFIHMLPGWLAGWHLPDLKIKGKCDRNKIDIATPIYNIHTHTDIGNTSRVRTHSQRCTATVSATATHTHT